MGPRYVSRREIGAMTGLGKTAVAAMVACPDFPTAVRLNARVVRYPLAEVERYLAARREAPAGGRRSHAAVHRADVPELLFEVEVA